MATHTDATTDDDAPTNEQAEYVQQIDRVVVDPDTVVETLEKNIRMRHAGGYTPRKFRLVGFKSDGEARVKVGVDPRDEGAYYDSKPHPIWITPKSFVEGFSHDDERDEPHWPDPAETKRVLRDEEGLDEDSDEFDELLEEWQDDALEVWREEVRRRLKDELTWEFRAQRHTEDGLETRPIPVTVAVEYEGGEGA